MKTVNNNSTITAEKINNSHKVLVEKNRLYMNVSNFNTGNVLADADRIIADEIDNLLLSLKMLSEVK